MQTELISKITNEKKDQALQTIYVLNQEILQFLGLKSAVYIWERFQIKSGL